LGGWIKAGFEIEKNHRAKGAEGCCSLSRFGVRVLSSGFGVRRSPFAGVRRSQDIGNTVTVLVSAIWQRGSIGFFVCGSLFF